MQIHISKNGKQLGPFDEAELTRQIENGTVSYDDLAWVEGMTSWQPLREIAEPVGSSDLEPSVSKTEPAAPVEQKTTPSTPSIAPATATQPNASVSRSATVKIGDVETAGHEGPGTSVPRRWASTIAGKLRTVGKLAVKEARLKKLQTYDLRNAFLALGDKVYASDFTSARLAGIREQINKTDSEIETAQTRETLDPTATLADKAKHGAAAAKQMAHAEMLKVTRKNHLTELGKAFYEENPQSTEFEPEKAAIAVLMDEAATLKREIDLIDKEGKGMPKKLLITTIVLIVIALGFTMKSGTASSGANNPPSQQAKQSKDSYSSSQSASNGCPISNTVALREQISSIEDATRFLVGIWTYTGPENGCISMADEMDLKELEKLGRTITQSMINQKRGPSNWFKYEFRTDGTFTKRTAMATSDSWGKPEDGKYTIELRKYKDTGEPYYKVNVSEYSYQYFIIDPNGVLECISNLGEYNKARFAVPRGDGNPFK